MSTGITIYGSGLVACLLGGGVLAWVLALPALFAGVHLIGIPLVLVCELAERGKLLSKNRRAEVLEVMMIGALVGIGLWCLSQFVVSLFGGFVLLMFLLRISFSSHWVPGDPDEMP